jgi:hypothetical protein
VHDAARHERGCADVDEHLADGDEVHAG